MAAVYLAVRVKEVIPTEMQTAQSICFVTAWERMVHPSQFDELCQQ
jgi:hypothetical protein